MKKYEYKVVVVDFSAWKGGAKQDYLPLINEMGAEGWRFVQFAPATAKLPGKKGIELVFERELP